MFEGDSADTCTRKFLLVSMGGQAEGLACADPGARAPIGARGNCFGILFGFSTPKELVSVFQSQFRITLKNVFIIGRANNFSFSMYCNGCSGFATLT
jgi:hypothetical protein